FLGSILPGDLQVIACLQGFAGLLLTGEMRYQRFLLLLGRPGSGKGTYLRVLTVAIGADRVGATDLDMLTNTRRASGLVGSPAAVVGDSRISGKDVTRGVMAILNITGEDQIPINPKHRAITSATLPTRLVVATNE